jgi:MinD-like ATPase involved in chromosome partitioning or flagellar assembly
MNIALIGQDQELRDQLQRLPGVGTVYAMKNDQRAEHQQILETCGLIIVSDREVEVFQMEEMKKQYSHAEIVYLISYRADAAAAADIALVCARVGVSTLPPKRTIAQLVGDIGMRYLHWNGESSEASGKVIAILGTHAQTGVTATALSLAHALIEGSGRSIKVGVLGFNCHAPGDVFMHYTGSFLNELHAQTDVLTTLELERHMYKHECGFFYLAGNADMTKKYRYPTAAAEQIINMAKQLFDVVILDAGASVDNNLCLQALLMADMRIVMTVNQPSAVRQWGRQREILQFVAPNLSYTLLANKVKRESEAKDLAQQLQLPLLGWLPVVDRAFECEREERLVTAESEKFRLQLQDLIPHLLQRFQMESAPELKKSWFGFGRRTVKA